MTMKVILCLLLLVAATSLVKSSEEVVEHFSIAGPCPEDFDEEYCEEKWNRCRAMVCESPQPPYVGPWTGGACHQCADDYALALVEEYVGGGAYHFPFQHTLNAINTHCRIMEETFIPCVRGNHFCNNMDMAREVYYMESVCNNTETKTLITETVPCAIEMMSEFGSGCSEEWGQPQTCETELKQKRCFFRIVNTMCTPEYGEALKWIYGTRMRDGGLFLNPFFNYYEMQDLRVMPYLVYCEGMWEMYKDYTITEEFLMDFFTTGGGVYSNTSDVPEGFIPKFEKLDATLLLEKAIEQGYVSASNRMKIDLGHNETRTIDESLLEAAGLLTSAANIPAVGVAVLLFGVLRLFL